MAQRGRMAPEEDRWTVPYSLQPLSSSTWHRQIKADSAPSPPPPNPLPLTRAFSPSWVQSLSASEWPRPLIAPYPPLTYTGTWSEYLQVVIMNRHLRDAAHCTGYRVTAFRSQALREATLHLDVILFLPLHPLLPAPGKDIPGDWRWQRRHGDGISKVTPPYRRWQVAGWLQVYPSLS